MQDLPHRYTVAATSGINDHVSLTSPGLERIDSAAPAEFGGPGDRWSPETLLVAAVADCFVLTFKAIARASSFDWASISCSVEATLDRVDKATRFTDFQLRVLLDTPMGTDKKRAVRLLEKAESACLITNSLSASTHLDIEVSSAD